MVTSAEASPENFAFNLARLCKREASIAAVCRGTRINRQQFNRYLAGRAIPNASNRLKICRYFKVSESDLFRSPGAARALAGPDVAAPNLHRPPWSHADVGAILRLLYSDSRPSIAPGIYTAHFSQLRERASVVQAMIVVRNDGNLTTFRRVTGLTERAGSWWGQFRGDHRGVVLERAHWLYFVGLNAARRARAEPAGAPVASRGAPDAGRPCISQCDRRAGTDCSGGVSIGPVAERYAARGARLFRGRPGARPVGAGGARGAGAHSGEQDGAAQFTPPPAGKVAGGRPEASSDRNARRSCAPRPPELPEDNRGSERPSGRCVG